MRFALTAVLVACLGASPVLAHGGQYKGPSDAGSGFSSTGGVVTPPTNPAGATAPGPGAAAGAAPGASGAVARTGGGRTARGGSARRGATTGAGVAEIQRGFDIWEFWWENNKDRFLNLKDRLIKTTNVSGSPGSLTGRGRKASRNDSRRPSRAEINSEVIPELLTLLRSEDDHDILDSAILALGRTADETRADQIVEAAMPLLSHNELSVQSSSTLALGVLGSPQASQMLQDLLQDNSAGRRLTGGGNIHWLTRAFAALSLGLIGDDAGVDTLMDVIQRLPDSDKDIKVCSIVGLAMLGPEHERRDDAASFLVTLLSDRKLDPLIKSYVPTALGKLGSSASIPDLIESFKDRDADNLVLQSAAIAFGRLASVTDEDVVETLMDYIEEGRDSQTRHFSIIALAEMGARDEDAEANQEAHDAIIERLTKEISGKGKSKEHRSWAALAGALYSRGIEDAQPTFVDRIKSAYKDESDPSFRSAFAIALGLLNDQTSAEQIFEDFNSRKEQDFRGYASVALGFMNYTDAADAMRGLVQTKATTPTLRLQVATGLGLMSDTQAVSVLIDTLNTANTLGVSSAVAKALGLIGDKDSIKPLKDIAVDENTVKLTRAFACVALGIVGEKTDLPWNAAIAADNNYRAKVPSIEEVLDIL